MGKLGIPAQDWWNVFISQDTRIKAGEEDVSVYEFIIEGGDNYPHLRGTVEITAKLIWRNTWPGLAKLKGIKLEEDIVIEKSLLF